MQTTQAERDRVQRSLNLLQREVRTAHQGARFRPEENWSGQGSSGYLAQEARDDVPELEEFIHTGADNRRHPNSEDLQDQEN